MWRLSACGKEVGAGAGRLSRRSGRLPPAVEWGWRVTVRVSAGTGGLGTVSCAGAVVLAGGREGVAANVFRLLQADLTGHSMNQEDWNAELEDEASPTLRRLEEVWGDNSWAVAHLPLFPFLPPWPCSRGGRWAAVPCSLDC